MKISTEERVLAVLSYLMLLFVIPLMAKRDSMFVQFHARQGAVMFALFAITSLVVLIVLAAATGVFVVETIFIAIWILAIVLYALFAIIAIIKVLLGERYRMPLVADIALKMNL